MDPDTRMLQELSYAITAMMVKFKASPLKDRVLLRPQLNEMLDDWFKYQAKLLKEGVITSPQDLQELESIKAEIDQAAKTQQLLLAIAHTVALIAAKA